MPNDDEKSFYLQAIISVSVEIHFANEVELG